MHCFVNIMYDSTVLIFYGDFKNPVEKQLFDSYRESPYRNYISNRFRRNDDTELVLYLTVIDKEAKVKDLARTLTERLGDRVRTRITDSEYEGYFYLKIFSPLATKQNMLEKLKEYTGINKALTFGTERGEFDVLIYDGGGNATVKRIKRFYWNLDD